MAQVVGVLSLEPWDDVWRRNQYLARSLVEQGFADEIVFIEPPGRKWAEYQPHERVTVVTPVLTAPKRAGGLFLLGRRLAGGALRRANILWINDPSLGVHCLAGGQHAVYDVTDDWRWARTSYRVWKRIVRAEDLLARQARTVVCSAELQARWRLRYGVEATVVNNGIDAEAWISASPRPLDGAPPHVGYVGTLHQERLDLQLVEALAASPGVGTVHLVGPNCLPDDLTLRLREQPKIRLDGPIAPHDVPAWTVSFDVLISPHLVSPFTLSLDAIKSYEYLASGRPVVATPTSGFQLLEAERLRVTEAGSFVPAVLAALGSTRVRVPEVRSYSWDERAREFAAALKPPA